jgi:hypothetical protein
MVEALFILMLPPFVGGGLVYLVLLFADALIGAATEYLGD